jgi:hypothetical protein
VTGGQGAKSVNRKRVGTIVTMCAAEIAAEKGWVGGVGLIGVGWLGWVGWVRKRTLRENQWDASLVLNIHNSIARELARVEWPGQRKCVSVVQRPAVKSPVLLFVAPAIAQPVFDRGLFLI